MFLCNLLRQRLETEAKAERQEIGNALDLMPVTKKFLFSVMECAELLCNVTIESSGSKAAPERSISHCSFAPDHGQQSQQCMYSLGLSRNLWEDRLRHVPVCFVDLQLYHVNNDKMNWKIQLKDFTSSSFLIRPNLILVPFIVPALVFFYLT